MRLRALDLFAGAGAPLLGVWLGWQHVAFVEKDPFCQAVLVERFPGVPIHSHAGKAPYARYRGRVDIITAGWPCQPHSLAGKRRGARDRRDGWHHVRSALRVVRPRLFLGENVAAVLSSGDGRYFGRCLCDLAALGYDAEWLVLGADQAGAPHRRARLFILAYARGAGCGEHGEPDEQPEQPGQHAPRRRDADGCGAPVADADVRESERARADRGMGEAPEEQRGEGVQRQRTGDSARSGCAPVADGHRISAIAGHVQERCADVAQRCGPVADAASGSPGVGIARQASDGDGAQSALGGVADGLANSLDWPALRGDWPSAPGEAQRPWEALRTCEGYPGRVEAIRALGNGWVIPQAALAWRLLTQRAGVAA